MIETLNIPMYRVVDDAGVFVEVRFTGTDYFDHTGLFMLDSGCDCNLLSYDYRELFPSRASEKQVNAEFLTLGNTKALRENKKYSFLMGSIVYDEVFSLTPNYLSTNIGSKPLFGILGTKFMQKHNIVIDYVEHTVHTSRVNHANLCIGDCDYFFTMEVGLEHFGVPVIPVKLSDKICTGLIDTGSDSNVVAKKILNDSGVPYVLNKETGYVCNITGATNTHTAYLDFYVQGMSHSGQEFQNYRRSSCFNVVPYDYILTINPGVQQEEDENPTIDVILGSGFISKENWILDFGAKIIYKRKNNNL